MTIGVIHVRGMRDYWTLVTRINKEFQRKTGFRPGLVNPALYTICNRCVRVEAECTCGTNPHPFSNPQPNK